MRLKCIKLAGFKSFVDPTTVDFPGNLSAVVGPNGCGKSNIIDAVRWVMGESSAKNLRGESMTDVIFNGSAGRKPIGQASIELVFDNSKGEIGGEYAAFSEIAIKRRVTRESQNHYFLNGQKCRRRDITDIFLGTGLGPRSYAIIEQGMISRLIESKPEELRVFIEEAAGISKYKERRKETESRMRRTLENLERLTDIRDELERQLQHLQRQSQAAEKYTQYKAEERLLTAQLQALQWQDLNETYQSGAEEINRLELEFESVVTEQTSLDATVEETIDQQGSAREAFNTVQSRFYSIGADIARAEQVIQSHKENQLRLQTDLADVTHSLDENRQLMQEDLEAMEALKIELLEIEPELALLKDAEEQSHDMQADLEERLQQWQDKWDAFNTQAAKAQQKVEVQQSRIQHSDTVIGRLNARSERLQAEIEAVSQKDIEDEIDLLEDELSELTEEVVVSEELQSSLQSDIEEKRETSQRYTQDLDQLKSSIQTGKGRLSSLEALQQAAFDEDNDRLKNWLKDQSLDGNSRLSDTLIVEDGWEEAVETVLSSSLQAVCVDTLAAFAEPIKQLDNANLCLIADTGCDWQTQFAGEPLLAKISSGTKLAGLLADVFVVDTLESALVLQPQLAANESLITPCGLWVGANWIKVRAKNETTQGYIKRKTEIESLKNKLDLECSKQEQMQVELTRCLADLTRCERERDAEQQNLKQCVQKKNSCQSSLAAKKAQIEQLISTKKRLVNDLQEVNEQSLMEQESLSEARILLQESIETMQVDVEKRQQLTDEKEQVRQSLETARQKFRQDKDLVHQLAMKEQSLNAKIDSLLQQKSRVEAHLHQFETRKNQIETEMSELTQPDSSLESELEVLLDKRLVVEDELAVARNKVESIDAAMRASEQKRTALQQQNHNIRSQLEKSRIAAQGIEVKRDALQKQLEETDFVLKQVLEEMPDNALQSLWQQNIEKLTNRINRLGAINLAAIDEYKQASERKNYLDLQNEDLEKALNTLENAIRKIDRETRLRFKDTFDKINTGIQELFPKVFGGGKAYLEMTGEDLLDTGVAIMAQPPGKKNSTIHLLSGGEKALTAISLVFSIFRLNPAPFCMLDEVDAPLDDANVGRYARMVQEMSGKVQFIYITHNKIAMEMASHLLGVTMHEPGVSRMVSVDVEEAAELAAM